MKVKMADVAKAANVSISTVSRALSGDDKRPVSAVTSRRIMAAAKRLGYGEIGGAAGLQKVLAGAPDPGLHSGLLFRHLQLLFLHPDAGGINEETVRLGYRVTSSFSVSQTNAAQVRDQISHGDFDGLILLGRYDTATPPFDIVIRESRLR